MKNEHSSNQVNGISVRSILIDCSNTANSLALKLKCTKGLEDASSLSDHSFDIRNLS